MSFYILVKLFFFSQKFSFSILSGEERNRDLVIPLRHDLYDVGTVSTKQFNAQLFVLKYYLPRYLKAIKSLLSVKTNRPSAVLRLWGMHTIKA